MTAATVGNIIDRAINGYLMGTFSAQYNQLATTVNSTATELTLTLPVGALGVGSFLAMDDELCYVADVDKTNNRVVVVRAVRGTTAASHTAPVAVEVNPRYPRFLCRQFLIDEIDSWPDSLYVVKNFAATLAANAGTITVPATIDGFTVRHVLNVRRASLNTTDDRYRRTDGYETQWDFDDTNVININCSIDVATDWRARVACAFQPTLAVSDATTTATLGLAQTMTEIVALGIAYRMLVAPGTVRLFPESETQSRSAAEVGARDIPILAQSMLAMRDRRISDEARRLLRRYGWGGN